MENFEQTTFEVNGNEYTLVPNGTYSLARLWQGKTDLGEFTNLKIAKQFAVNRENTKPKKAATKDK